MYRTFLGAIFNTGDDATLLSYRAGVKDRSIGQPSQGKSFFRIFSSLWNGGIFETFRLRRLRTRSCVPIQTSIQILGTKGDILWDAHATIISNEMFGMGSTLVSSTMPNMISGGWCYLLSNSGQYIIPIDYPPLIKPCHKTRVPKEERFRRISIQEGINSVTCSE